MSEHLLREFWKSEQEKYLSFLDKILFYGKNNFVVAIFKAKAAPMEMWKAFFLINIPSYKLLKSSSCRCTVWWDWELCSKVQSAVITNQVKVT